MQTMSIGGMGPLLVIIGLIVLARIVMSQLNERSRKVSRLWVMPAVMLFVSYAAIEQGLFSNIWGPLLMLPAILIGGAIGLIRCYRVGLRLGPESGTILVKGSIGNLAIWAAMIVIRLLIEYFAGGFVGATYLAAITSALIVLSLSNMVFYYGYMYVRYLNLVKATEPGASIVP